MKFANNVSRAPALTGLLGLLLAGLLAAEAQEPRRILLTVEKSTAEPLTAAELDLRVGKKPADVLRVYQPQERPVQLALLIADDTGRDVTQSLPALASLLRSLPRGSQILVGYVHSTSLEVEQPFTGDADTAAGALRAPSGAASAGITNLGQIILDALELFPAAPSLRGQILYLGEAQADPDPYQDVTFNRAITKAQRAGVAVWVMRVQTASRPEDFAGTGRTRAQTNLEQPPAKQPATIRDRAGVADATTPTTTPLAPPSIAPPFPAMQATFLQRLSEETGGRAYALGARPPALAPFLEEVRALLDRQYLVEFTPPTGKKGEAVSGKLSVRVRGQQVSLLHPER